MASENSSKVKHRYCLIGVGKFRIWGGEEKGGGGEGGGGERGAKV